MMKWDETGESDEYLDGPAPSEEKTESSPAFKKTDDKKPITAPREKTEPGCGEGDEEDPW